MNLALVTEMRIRFVIYVHLRRKTAMKGCVYVHNFISKIISITSLSMRVVVSFFLQFISEIPVLSDI